MPVKRQRKSRKARLEVLFKKAGLHKSAIHLYQSDSATARKSRKLRKRVDAPMGASGAMNRRERQLNTLVHKLYYQLEDEKKRG